MKTCRLILVCIIFTMTCVTGPTRATRMLSAKKPDPPSNLWEFLTSRPNLSILMHLVKTTEMQNFSFTDKNDNSTGNSNKRVPLLMLMPVDSAFQEFFDETGGNLTFLSSSSYRMTLLDTLRYHLITAQDNPLKVDLQPNKELVTLYDSSVIHTLTDWDDRIALQDVAGRTAHILGNPISCGSWASAITISKLLVPVSPPRASNALEMMSHLSMFKQALYDVGYSSYLSSSSKIFTLLAPTNTAFQFALDQLNMTYKDLALDKDNLKWIVDIHVLDNRITMDALRSNYRWFSTRNPCAIFCTGIQDNGQLELNGNKIIAGSSAVVIEGDRIANSGGALIHVLDSVLLPEATLLDVACRTGLNLYHQLQQKLQQLVVKGD